MPQGTDQGRGSCRGGHKILVYGGGCWRHTSGAYVASPPTEILHILPVTGQEQRQQQQVFNLVKYFSNVDICFSCKFNLPSWHSSIINWQKEGHHTGYNYSNWWQCKNTGHRVYTENWWNNLLPTHLIERQTWWLWAARDIYIKVSDNNIVIGTTIE